MTVITSIRTVAVPEVPACPSWCEADHSDEPSHRYHYGNEFLIRHIAGDYGKETDAFVATIREDGENQGTAGVSVFADGRLTAAQARHLASLLTTAADRLQGIASGVSPSRPGGCEGEAWG